ncbi:hypothetical protein D3C80_1365870 [compost metagenome]
MRKRLVLRTLFRFIISGLSRPVILPADKGNHRILFIFGIGQHLVHQHQHQVLPFLRITCHQALVKHYPRRLLCFLLKLQLEQLMVKLPGQQFFEIAHIQLLLLSVHESKRQALPMINLAAVLHNIHVKNIV